MFTVQHVSPHISSAYIIFGHWYTREAEACRLENDTPRWFVGLWQISAPLYILSVFLRLRQAFLHTYRTCGLAISASWSKATNTLRSIIYSNNQESLEHFTGIATKGHCMGNRTDINACNSANHDRTSDHAYNIPYGRKLWREDILADCWKYFIWRNLLWRWASLSHNNIHSKMANRTRWEFNRAVS